MRRSVLKWVLRRRWILLVGLFFITRPPDASAQEKGDSLDVSIPIEKSPRVAILRSAILPGWGQLYNGQKLKALLVFGGEMALLGNAIYYNQQAAKSTTDDELRFYQDTRSRFLWWLMAVHLLNILDAYVDAHLWNFDTGPDLSMGGGDEGQEYTLITLSWTF